MPLCILAFDMKNLSKVVWSEGMYLGTHHFQAQNRYFEDLIHFTSLSLWFAPYGLLSYEVDAEALRNGSVSLVRAKGVFPDGLVFDMPDSDPLPTPLNVTELFPPTQQRLRVDLAIPAYRADALNCNVTPNGSLPNTRYAGRPQTLADENTGRDEKPVQLAFKNIRLALETEASEGMVTLPLARVTRDGSGHFIFDREFVPPCLDIAASEALLSLIRRLIEDLEERTAAISRSGGRKGKLASGLSSQDVANFWYLHSLNSALAPLRHIYTARRGHPEHVFLELSRLAGALCTFKTGSHPADIPLYDHDNLESCFKKLEEHIRTHLLTIFPQNALSIALKPVAKYLYEGEIRDQRCIDRARWIFGVHSEIGEVEIISRAPHLVKICSGQFVVELVKRALPGLTLTHMPTPPAAVSPKVTNQYFSVNLSGPCWEHIVKTRRVGIYVPGEIPAFELELWVLLDE